MIRTVRAIPQVGAAIITIVTIAACGGSGSPSAPTAPQPVVLNYSRVVPSGTHWFQTFQALRAGTMTVTVNWNDGAKDLDLYVTREGCNYWEDRCASQILGRSERATGTQEQVSGISVQSGIGYTFWVLNYGAAEEEARVVVRIE